MPETDLLNQLAPFPMEWRGHTSHWAISNFRTRVSLSQCYIWTHT